MTIGLTKDFSPLLRVGGGWGEVEPAINPPPMPITPTLTLSPQGGGKVRGSPSGCSLSAA